MERCCVGSGRAARTLVLVHALNVSLPCLYDRCIITQSKFNTRVLLQYTAMVDCMERCRVGHGQPGGRTLVLVHA